MVLVAVTYAAEQYTTKHDNLDIDKILNNNRILTNYIKCIMEQGPCTPEGRELRSKFFTLVFVYILNNFHS